MVFFHLISCHVVLSARQPLATMKAASAVEIQRVFRVPAVLLGAQSHVASEMQLQPPAHAQSVRFPPRAGPPLDLRRRIQHALLLIPDQLLLCKFGTSFILLREEADLVDIDACRALAFPYLEMRVPEVLALSDKIDVRSGLRGVRPLVRPGTDHGPALGQPVYQSEDGIRVRIGPTSDC